MKTLFYGGKILTMNDDVYADAVLVENDKISELGSLENLEKKADKKINLEGRTMMPSFLDAHSHFFQVATSLLRVSLDGVSDIEEMKHRIDSFIAENDIKQGEWLMARDYDNNIMPEYKNPDIDVLDYLAPNNPIVIHHKSGHMGLMNSLAFDKLGITSETPSPAGGNIEKKDGRLTGYLEENAFFDYLKKIPMPSLDVLLNSFNEAQNKYASYGITTVQDGMVVAQMLPLYELLLQRDMLKIDVKLFADVETYEQIDEMLKKYPNNRHLSLGGVKIFLDGSPQGRTAYMREPYADDESYCGYPTMTDEQVIKAFEFSAKKNAQLISHCNGDAAAEQFIRCLEIAEKDYPQLKELRPVIIHGQLMGVDQLAKARELGAMVSFFVAHTYHWGDVHLRNFGKARGENISPTNSALKAGLKFTFHQDAPVIEPDMLETVWCAVNRITKNGVELSRDERLSTAEALKAVTKNVAYQYFDEENCGDIEVGKDASFVVLSDNPLEIDAELLRNISVLETYKNGEIIYKR